MEVAFLPGAFRYLRVTWDDASSARLPLPRRMEARTTRSDVPTRPVEMTPIAFERRASEPGTQCGRIQREAADRVDERQTIGARLGREFIPKLDEGTLVGILCRCDLDEAEPGAEVSDCMSVPVMTIHPDASLAAAAATMADFEVGCLPVVAGGLILGMLSEDELARAGTAAPRAAGRCRCHRRTRLPAAH